MVHAIKTVDAQPSGCGGILVFCCGDLKVCSAALLCSSLVVCLCAVARIYISRWYTACAWRQLDDTENPVKFAQTFHLMPTDATAKNFWVHNDIFRTSLPWIARLIDSHTPSPPHSSSLCVVRLLLAYAGLNYG